MLKVLVGFQGVAIMAILSACSLDANKPADPLSDFVGQLNSAGRPPTEEERCRLGFLIMASP